MYIYIIYKVAGADSKFAMLRNKPNISKMGLYKVTNDKSALLRAEKETTRRITEINKLRPALERREERQLAAADAAADAATATAFSAAAAAAAAFSAAAASAAAFFAAAARSARTCSAASASAVFCAISGYLPRI